MGSVGRKKEKVLVKHMTLNELENKIKREEKVVRILERLYFIRFLYKGDTIKEACDKVNISEPTGYSWLESWNESAYEGLVPHFSGGPKPKLDTMSKDELISLLKEKESWTLKEVQRLIKEKFQVDYSQMQVWRILKSLKMHYAKPYVLDKRRPEDAEAILKKD
jgi:putative transposase